MLPLLTVWALVTVMSSVALVAFLAFDERQARVRADAEDRRAAEAQAAVDQTTRPRSPQAA